MKAICKVEPQTSVAVHDLGITVINNHEHKPIYVRLGRKSVTVSDRKPANYGGVKRG